MDKLIKVTGVLKSAAYIDNKYMLAGDKFEASIKVTSRRGYPADVFTLDEESEKLVEKTIKELQSLKVKAKVAPKANKDDNKSLV